MHVDAGGFEAVIERQRLEDLTRDVQPDVPVDAPVIGIKVVRIPLEGRVGGALGVSGAVIHLDGQDVLLWAEVNGVGDVQAVGRHPVLVKPNWLAIQEDVAGLPYALEFEEDPIVRQGRRKLEMLAVPGQSLVGAEIAPAVGDDLTK